MVAVMAEDIDGGAAEHQDRGNNLQMVAAIINF